MDSVMYKPNLVEAFEAAYWVFLVLFTNEMCLQLYCIMGGTSFAADDFCRRLVRVDIFIRPQSAGLPHSPRRSPRHPNQGTERSYQCTAVCCSKFVCHCSAPTAHLLRLYTVMCTQQFKEMHSDGLTGEDWFSRLDTTFFTLLRLMLGR